MKEHYNINGYEFDGYDWLHGPCPTNKEICGPAFIQLMQRLYEQWIRFVDSALPGIRKYIDPPEFYKYIYHTKDDGTYYFTPESIGPNPQIYDDPNNSKIKRSPIDGTKFDVQYLYDVRYMLLSVLGAYTNLTNFNNDLIDFYICTHDYYNEEWFKTYFKDFPYYPRQDFNVPYIDLSDKFPLKFYLKDFYLKLFYSYLWYFSSTSPCIYSVLTKITRFYKPDLPYRYRFLYDFNQIYSDINLLPPNGITKQPERGITYFYKSEFDNINPISDKIFFTYNRPKNPNCPENSKLLDIDYAEIAKCLDILKNCEVLPSYEDFKYPALYKFPYWKEEGLLQVDQEIKGNKSISDKYYACVGCYPDFLDFAIEGNIGRYFIEISVGAKTGAYCDSAPTACPERQYQGGAAVAASINIKNGFRSNVQGTASCIITPDNGTNYWNVEPYSWADIWLDVLEFHPSLGWLFLNSSKLPLHLLVDFTSPTPCDVGIGISFINEDQLNIVDIYKEFKDVSSLIDLDLANLVTSHHNFLKIYSLGISWSKKGYSQVNFDESTGVLADSTNVSLNIVFNKFQLYYS